MIVQVLGPNLEPRFPECLANEPDRARYLLRQCYDKSLDSFWKQVSSETSGATAVVATSTAAADIAGAASAAAAPGVSGGGGRGHCSGSAAAADTGVGKEGVTKRKR